MDHENKVERPPDSEADIEVSSFILVDHVGSSQTACSSFTNQGKEAKPLHAGIFGIIVILLTSVQHLVFEQCRVKKCLLKVENFRIECWELQICGNEILRMKKHN